jgi:HSP20 family protein
MFKDILEEMRKFQEEMDLAFNNFFYRKRALAPGRVGWSPSVDIYETEEGLNVLVELAGVEAEDFKLTIDDRNVLHIEGIRKHPLSASKQRNYHGMEINFGTFSRNFRLPVPVDAHKVKISNMNGLYKLEFRKKKEKVTRIKIE